MLKNQHLFCFGLGYCANVLSNQLKQVGWKVSGTSQSENSSPTIHMFTGDQPMALESNALAGISHILISIPPGTDQDPTLEWHKTDILKLNSLQWVGYLSTTGVYGNTDGEWVDETAITTPTSPRSQSRLNAETEWLNLFHENNVPVHVFRCREFMVQGGVRLIRCKRVAHGGSTNRAISFHAFMLLISPTPLPNQWPVQIRGAYIMSAITKQPPRRK